MTPTKIILEATETAFSCGSLRRKRKRAALLLKAFHSKPGKACLRFASRVWPTPNASPLNSSIRQTNDPRRIPQRSGRSRSDTKWMR